MAFDFLKLPDSARRAAFAHMTAADKAKKTTVPKTGAANTKMTAAKRTKDPQQNAIREARRKLREQDRAHRDLSRTVQHVDGNGQVLGRISLEDAAVKMFGRDGANARIAKANARRRRK